MSPEEDAAWFTIAEKVFAIFIIIIGAILVYYTAMTSGVAFSIFFSVGGLALIVLGAFMILAKPT